MSPGINYLRAGKMRTQILCTLVLTIFTAMVPISLWPVDGSLEEGTDEDGKTITVRIDGTEHVIRGFYPDGFQHQDSLDELLIYTLEQYNNFFSAVYEIDPNFNLDNLINSMPITSATRILFLGFMAGEINTRSLGYKFGGFDLGNKEYVVVIEMGRDKPFDYIKINININYFSEISNYIKEDVGKALEFPGENIIERTHPEHNPELIYRIESGTGEYDLSFIFQENIEP